MNSGLDTLERVGFPIRTSADQRSLASPRGFSQRATSFIASWRQGIHRTPLSRSHHAITARTQDQTAPCDTSVRAIPNAPLILTYAYQPIHLHLSKNTRPAATPLAGRQRQTAVLEVRLAPRPGQPRPAAKPRDADRPRRSAMDLYHPRARSMARPSPGGLEATGFEPVTPCLQSRCSTS